MAKILTGIQSSGTPHLGNILGAILPTMNLIEQEKDPAFLFIADLHSLTSNKDPEIKTGFTYEIAASWLAFGLDTHSNIFYRQSKIPEVCELKWYLECFTPYPMLVNAHSFKDKSNNLSNVNSGLFTYPVLMAADILLYDGEIVPVGKDQKQHLEITRDIAKSFNSYYKTKAFIIPEVKIDKKVMTIPGIDGRKMSKSYNNTINIFLPEKTLKKQIMSIKTDSIPVEEPKDPNKCIVFNIYDNIAPRAKSIELRQKYIKGGYGYGDAKKKLLSIILELFSKERTLYNKIIVNKTYIENVLKVGEEKAREVASKKLKAIRKILY